MRERTALIVGAGIGGLAAGIALRRAGWRTRVFERAGSPRELGFALSLAPNAINALRELGVADRILAEGHALAQAELRRADGRVLKRIGVTGAMAGTPAVMALRQVLHGTLLSATDPGSLVLGREAVGFDRSGPAVSLRMRDGSTESGDVLIGADGIASAIRACLHPHQPPLRASGYVGIRGVAHGAGDVLGPLSAVGYYGLGLEAATVRASADAIYWFMSLLAADVPPGTPAPGPIVDRMAARLDEPFRAIVRATRPGDVRLDTLYDRDPTVEWGAGPVTLLGDAAHPMLPHTGQGAAQAIEDAVALGIVLASGDDPAASLRRYERVRSARTASLVKRGRMLARFTTSNSQVFDRIRAAGLRLIPAKQMAAAFMLTDAPDPHQALRAPAR